VQMGLIYVNPEGPNGQPSVLASARGAANEISRALGAPEGVGRNRAVRADSP